MTRRFQSYLWVIVASFAWFYRASHAQGWQWQNPLPQGDNLRLITFFDRNHGWVVSEGPILLRTKDGGAHWEILRTGIVFNDIHFINAQEGWGIGNPRFDTSKWSVYHTTNGGATWEIQLADTTVRNDIFFLDSQNGWATNNGIIPDELLYTNDGGKTWVSQAKEMFRFTDEVFSVKFLDLRRGWGVGGLLWGIQTNDGGKTWARDSTLFSIRQIFFVDSLHGWGRSAAKSIVRTTDGGATWIRIQVVDASEVRTNQFFAFDTSRCFLALNIGLYSSIDGGRNWTLHSSKPLTSFAFLDSTEIWGVAGNGLLHSRDGGRTWANLTENIFASGATFLSSLDFINPQVGWVAGLNVTSANHLEVKSGIIWKTNDGGKTWLEQWKRNGVSLGEIVFINEHKGWGVGSSEYIIHTRDGGQSWEIQNSGTDFILRAAAFTDTLHGWTVGGAFLNNGVAGIILSTNDGGESWTNQTPMNVPRLWDVSFVDSLKGWIVGGGGSGFDSGIILRTRDGGQTWQILRQGVGLDFEKVVFTDTLHGWVGGYDTQNDAIIIHTQDGGLSWLPQLKGSYFPFDIKFVNNRVGWATSFFGRIYYTEDGGLTWNKQQSYTSQHITAIDFVNVNNGWAVGDFGTILYTTNGGVTAVKLGSPKVALPKSFILYDNYPNPFNSGTTIKFEILQPRAKVSLSIYNLQGHFVEKLFEGNCSIGVHQVLWQGKDHYGVQCASGIYFYRLEVNHTLQIGKAVLLK